MSSSLAQRATFRDVFAVREFRALWFSQILSAGGDRLALVALALGADRPETLSSRSNLAAAYQDAGRTAEAISLLERTLADRERVLGADHPKTMRTRRDLAAAYQVAGRTAEAITLHEQTLAAFARLLGPDHPSTLASRNDLATARQVAGGANEADAHEP